MVALNGCPAIYRHAPRCHPGAGPPQLGGFGARQDRHDGCRDHRVVWRGDMAEPVRTPCRLRRRIESPGARPGNLAAHLDSGAQPAACPPAQARSTTAVVVPVQQRTVLLQEQIHRPQICRAHPGGPEDDTFQTVEPVVDGSGIGVHDHRQRACRDPGLSRPAVQPPTFASAGMATAPHQSGAPTGQPISQTLKMKSVISGSLGARLPAGRPCRYHAVHGLRGD
jgi:hypothetical protein